MCGFVGFIDKKRNLDILNSMLQIQSYRGYDDKGMYFDEKSGVHFGYNRLSVIDLSQSAHQPF